MLDRGADILCIQGLTKRFAVRRPWVMQALSRQPRPIVHAVEDVSLAIDRGTTFALVGESGCGKSTIARCIAGILTPTAGTMTFMGADIMARTRGAGTRPGQLGHVFFDP